jgi:Gpi18-like mannosyltransferase
MNDRTGVAGRLQECFVPFYLSTLLVWAGVLLGVHAVELCEVHPEAAKESASDSPLERMAAWDGAWYRRIAERGYSYAPSAMSSVAFFPAYPLLTRATAWLLGIGVDEALLLVSHAALFGALVVFHAYLQSRSPPIHGRVRNLALISLAVFPTSFYLRMAYTESLFMLLCIATLYGMERRWPPIAVAIVIGLATATRPTGVALLLPLVHHSPIGLTTRFTMGRSARC